METKPQHYHVKVNGDPMLIWRDNVCALANELIPRSEPLISPTIVRRKEKFLVCSVVKSSEAWRVSGSWKSPGWDGVTGEICKAVWQVIPFRLYGMAISLLPGKLSGSLWS